MRVRNFSHKGLSRFYEEDSAKEVPAAAKEKSARMLAVLDAMQNAEQIRGLQLCKPHQLTGERAGTWSLFVTRNWRLTFWIDTTEPAICDLNLEDYH